VGLNIKNPEVHRLARELADLTGESMTQSIAQALRERLERERRRREVDAKIARVHEFLDSVGPFEGAHSLDHGDLLCGEHGLPK
jgi:antitoxin VapB